jgi:hypothetical protein
VQDIRKLVNKVFSKTPKTSIKPQLFQDVLGSVVGFAAIIRCKIHVKHAAAKHGALPRPREVIYNISYN